MTQRDKWKKRPSVLRYRAFCDEVRARGVVIPEYPAFRFVLPMPKSWSQKKQAEMDGTPHKQRPDLDNLVKALFDAVYAEDAHMHCFYAEKRWGRSGQIWIDDMGGPLELDWSDLGWHE